MKHLMIDLETLGTNIDSQVISIGAVVFTLDGVIHKRFHTGVKPDYNENIPCTLGTIKFWMEQPDESRAALLNTVKNGVDVVRALTDLAKFFSDSDVEYVWANGTKFDLGMVEHMMHEHGVPVPWRHNADRCMRTLRYITKDLYKVDVYQLLPEQEGAHDALSDAEYQAAFVCKALHIIEQGI